MSKRRYCLSPCPNYDLEGTESWLQDMAKEGWFLTQDGFIFNIAVFEEGTATNNMRYRLEAAPKERSMWDNNNGEPDDEARQLSEELGWKYICSRGQFYIYASADPAAPELNTDPEVQAFTIKLLKKRLRSNMFHFGTWLAVYTLLSLSRYFFSTLVTLDWWLLLAIVLLLPLEVLLNVRSSRYLRNLQKRLEDGQEPNHHADWQKGKGSYWGLSALNITLLVVLFSSILSMWSADILKENRIKLQDYTEKIPFVTMENMVAGSFQYDDYGDWTNYVEPRSTLLAPLQLNFSQTGSISTPDGKRYRGIYDVQYVECRFAWMAEIIAKEMVKFEMNNNHRDDSHYFDLSNDSMDYFCAFSAFMPTVVVADGNKVITAEFTQTSDERIPLEVWTSTVADSLN